MNQRPYGTLQLVESSPALPITERFDIDEAKIFLRSQTATDAEDLLIEEYISSARIVAEDLQGKDLVRKQYDLLLDYFVCHEIELRHPLVSVDEIVYTDSDGNDTTLDPALYFVDTARGLVMPAYGESWPSFTPSPSSAVRIRFTSGYAHNDLFWSHRGKQIMQGMRSLITMWYWNRIPYVPFGSSNDAKELPYGVTRMLSWGALDKVR